MAGVSCNSPQAFVLPDVSVFIQVSIYIFWFSSKHIIRSDTIYRNMNKKEIVYRNIACSYIDGNNRFTQLGLSKELGISISTVNSAVRDLAGINAVRISTRSFAVSAIERVLFYWASCRKLDRDVIYSTRVDAGVREIEADMPMGIAFTAYTAYVLTYKDAPADYSEVYVYVSEEAVDEIKERFSVNKGIPNLFVMRADDDLDKWIKSNKIKRSSVCPAQAFVDLWNIRTWYAKEFSDAILKRIGV